MEHDIKFLLGFNLFFYDYKLFFNFDKYSYIM